MAAYAALVSLLNIIDHIDRHPRLSTSLDHQHIQLLHEKTSFLLDFIEGNRHGGGSKKPQDLERKIASAAHAAEDLIENHIVDQIFLVKCVGCHVSDRSENPLDLQQINQDMDVLKVLAMEYLVKCGEEQQPNVTEPFMQSGESGMVGLDEELNKLLAELTGNQFSRNIISIIGAVGAGKTTLAKHVYRHLLVKKHFQFHGWANVSGRNDAQKVLSALLSSLGESTNGLVGELGRKLNKTLCGKRYLIILDDLSSVEVWNEVDSFFPDDNNGSRILLTNRFTNMGKDCGSSLIEMNLSDEENNWKLFRQKVFQQDEYCSPEMLEIGKKIVKLCNGVPFSIVAIAERLLKSPRVVGYWKKVERNWNSKEKQGNMARFFLSYNYLPPHLQLCFLYMGVFRKDSEIRVSKIIKLWIGEGLIKPSSGRCLEEIAENYIHELIDRNLILACSHSKNGTVASCRVHDRLRDLCINEAEQEEFFHLSTRGIRGTERRLVDEKYLERMGVRLPVTRSILTRGYIKKPIGCRLLRVLDQDGYNPEADYYYGNVNLRYFAYDLPENVKAQLDLFASISLMWNLQTLIIEKSFQSLVVAPIEFWKMVHLRHVKCHQIYLPSPPPQGDRRDELLMLENLHTIKRVVNLRLCEEVCKIIPNIKNLHLLYDHKLKGYNYSLIECLCNLHRLHGLESLALQFTSQVLLLHRELMSSFPRSLKKLTLANFKFEWDDMIIIGSLPQLEALTLEYILVLHGERYWSPVDGQFHRLKFLEIVYCELDLWDAEDSHFPVLEKLILRNLYILEEIPMCIGNIPTLELIIVKYCRVSAAISAVKIQEDQLEYGGQLQVQVWMESSDVESFNNMLKTEELNIDNIEFHTGRFRW